MTDDPDSKGRERRKEQRHRTVRAAITRFDSPLSPIPCVMLDASGGGARLHVHDSTLIPDEFHLHLESDKIIHTCRVVWRTKNEVGVKFAQ